MADEIDRAQDVQEFYNDLAMRRRSFKPIVLENPSQECFFCGGETETTLHRWCSPECRRAWEIENE